MSWHVGSSSPPPPSPRGSNLGPCCWERGVLATGPPGKSLNHRSHYCCIMLPFVSIVTGMGLPSSPPTPSSLLSPSACLPTLTCTLSWLLLLSPSSLLPGAGHRSPAPLCRVRGVTAQARQVRWGRWRSRPSRGGGFQPCLERAPREGAQGRLWPARPARPSTLVSWPRWAVVRHVGSPHSHCLQPKP